MQSWIVLGGLLLLALLVGWLSHKLLPRLVHRMVEATTTHWDDALIARGVLRQVSHLAPVIVVYLGIAAIPALPDDAVGLLRKVLIVLIVFFVARGISRFLSAANDIYERQYDTHGRPIKGYVQLGKLLVFLLAAIVVVAVLIGRSPLLLLSGLGALGAVLMLVFKDTILSLVASVQIASNDLLRVGDWITMPSLGVDGDVVDIALNTVRVQNFDKTIVTVPTYRLVSDSFINWRGMSDSGGRRIKRSFYIDQASVRFLDEETRARLSGFALLDKYLHHKHEELLDWNGKLGDAAKQPVNTRRLTNLGSFRAYVTAYLQANPLITADKTLMVRQLAPGPTGLPMEVYCFADTTDWGDYEGIQADLFDHLLAILPEFGLRLFQQPTGADLAGVLKRPQPAGIEKGSE
ncbi:mechanosensitive ion channel family protein [Thermomonas sp.]|uniref:mechanosensitive ion channel family protein n=1 Tax=Thermomonas sp. TaxID=1971895 RepID=UPI002487F440|nr:mechanosensitive ion channel family protein [Thermomonas sp.]MDI1252732.1 mechanosensitive ion channel family protein [Thermomonas sp.]